MLIFYSEINISSPISNTVADHSIGVKTSRNHTAGGITMLGKQKCRILKEIRQKIADENDIPYVTQECRHQGNCLGTCPRCESELRYLERQLALRASLGKRISVAALCAGMAFTGAACGTPDTPDPGETLSGEVAPYETVCPTEEPVIEVESGEVAWNGETDDKTDPAPLPDNPIVEIDNLELGGMVPFDG